MGKPEDNSPENKEPPVEVVAVDEVGAAPGEGAVELDGEEESAADIGGVSSLAEQLERAQAELAEAKDQAVRALAEAQNARRRAEKDVSNARKFALERFVAELLPVIDNLERTMDAAQSTGEAGGPLLEGVELTSKNFLDVLKRFNVEQLDPVSEPFDPEYHQAISKVPNAEVEPNTVLNVVQKGYTLNGRLVRPAMVVVSSS